MAAAEKFKAPEASTTVGEVPSTVAQPIQEESDEEEVKFHSLLIHIKMLLLGFER